MSKSLKCYVAGSNSDSEYTHCAVCFAYTAKTAKMLMWRDSQWLAERCEGDLLDAFVVREKRHDSLAEGDTPYVVNDHEQLREMGWRMEDDSYCDSCGLYGMEVVNVCGDCNQCDECGCECENKPASPSQGGE